SKAFVFGKWLQLAQFAQIGDPALTDRVANCASERGIRQEQPAPRCDAVGLVVKALGKHLGQVFNGGRAKQFGVDCGGAVGTVRSDDRQVGHAHVFFWSFLDQADSSDASLVAGETGPNVVEQTAIDFKNDLEVTRYQPLKPLDWPFLERFRQ